MKKSCLGLNCEKSEKIFKIGQYFAELGLGHDLLKKFRETAHGTP